MIRLIALSYLALLGLAGCKQEPIPETFIPNTGQIQVLNGCGIAGAAESMRDFLSDQGFDVIEYGNAATWAYPRTLVIHRSGPARMAEDLAKVLGGAPLLHLEAAPVLAAATVIIGKDFQELSKRWETPKKS